MDKTATRVQYGESRMGDHNPGGFSGEFVKGVSKKRGKAVVNAPVAAVMMRGTRAHN